MTPVCAGALLLLRTVSARPTCMHHRPMVHCSSQQCSAATDQHRLLLLLLLCRQSVYASCIECRCACCVLCVLCGGLFLPAGQSHCAGRGQCRYRQQQRVLYVSTCSWQHWQLTKTTALLAPAQCSDFISTLTWPVIALHTPTPEQLPGQVLP